MAAGSIKVARDPLAQLRLLLTVFALGIAIGSSRNRDLDRTVFLCTALAAKLVLWFAEMRAADGGGRLLRVRCLLLLLDVGLSAAICFLFLEPVAGDILTCYKLGCDVSMALEAAVVVVVVVSVVAALAVGLHLLDR